MALYKSNITVNSSVSGIAETSRRANISDLIRKVKEEEKREKILKIYTIFFTIFFVCLFGLYIIL